MLNFNREMKDPKRVRWLTLLAALGLLYVGIDRMFFDRIVGSDPLARIERTLAILVGTLLVAVSISLFVAAWTGRPSAAMNTNSFKGKLLAHAFSAPGAAVMVLFGASLIADLLWTRREVRRLAASEIAKKAATQFLWSCIFFSMLSLSFGFAVSGLIWYSTDFLRILSAIWFGALTCVGIYPVVRDTKRLADTAAPSQINSVR